MAGEAVRIIVIIVAIVHPVVLMTKLLRVYLLIADVIVLSSPYESYSNDVKVSLAESGLWHLSDYYWKCELVFVCWPIGKIRLPLSTTQGG